MTIREFLSTISVPLQAVTMDSWLAPKYLYNQSQSILADFLKKDVSSNGLVYKITEGWSEISNLNMVEVPVTSVNLPTSLCQKLMRSKDRLPDIYSSKFGSIIKQVMSINFHQDYINCFTPKQWQAIQNRKDKSGRYFFFLDGYLYIPIPKGDQSSPEMVRIEAYFKNKFDVYKYISTKNPCPECKDNCKKFLDYDMVIPFWLESDVKKEISRQIMQGKQIPPDEYPNVNKNDKNQANDR